MQRVSILLDLIGDEAEQVVAAIASTGVRFAGLPFDEIWAMTMASASSPPAPDSIIAHEARSDGAVYAGKAKFKLEQVE